MSPPAALRKRRWLGAALAAMAVLAACWYFDLGRLLTLDSLKASPFEVTRYGLDELDRAIADGTANGFVKVLTVPGKDKILGAVIVGAQAGDLLAEFVLAMKHGLGLNKILGTIHIYPTLAEANKYAAGEWKRAHAPQQLLRWAAKYPAWERR